MAPELLEGRDADARSDVFAFGAVLYEMLTGQRAFQARTVAGVIGAVLHTDPESLSTLHERTPPALDRLVARCLAKDPDDRWQTARDVVLELQWIQRRGANPCPFGASTGSTPVAGRSCRCHRRSSRLCPVILGRARSVQQWRRLRPLRILFCQRGCGQRMLRWEGRSRYLQTVGA